MPPQRFHPDAAEVNNAIIADNVFMAASTLGNILELNGLRFIRALLEWEESRFRPTEFKKGSTFEEINSAFGSFPSERAFPVYFAGDITKPEKKHIFVGINPGFSSKPRQADEQRYLEENDSFEGYCRIFSDFFAEHERRLIPYFGQIARFIRKLYDFEEETDNWTWLQQNLISLDVIPFHSSNASGLRINEPDAFRRNYLEILVRIIEHLNPTRPIFFNGFPTIKRMLDDKRSRKQSGSVASVFADVIKISKPRSIFSGAKIATGTFANRFPFIGLPFLIRLPDGIDPLVDEVRQSTPFRQLSGN